ncbi:MAG: hypothetical protein MJ233_03515 [Mycoplasmoidaceae bacterium]|nr:hypothetical protein [Mycoplasmoidaceae bacterium]
MKKVTKPNLTFILLGVVLAAVFFFAAIFTCIYSFRGSDSIGYYIGATVLQGITVVLSFLFMFLPDCLYSY